MLGKARKLCPLRFRVGDIPGLMGSAHTQEVVHACAPGRSSLRQIRRALCAYASGTCAGASPCARPLRRGVPASRFAVPVRRPAPKPAPGHGHSPRLFRSACVRRWRGSVALAAPAVPSPCRPLCCGLLWSPLRRFGAGRFLAWVAGPPLARPLWGFGPGWLRPGGNLRAEARSFCLLPPGLFLCAACTRAALFVLSRCAWLCGGSWSVGSPLRPSRPRRPRWGLRGSAGLILRGLWAPTACGSGPPGVLDSVAVLLCIGFQAALLQAITCSTVPQGSSRAAVPSLRHCTPGDLSLACTLKTKYTIVRQSCRKI